MRALSSPGADWLASGGAFLVLGIQTVVVIIAGILVGLYVGRISQAEGDGCLLAIANTVLALLGAAIGFFSTSYPYFIFTALVGSVALPMLATAVFSRQISRHR